MVSQSLSAEPGALNVAPKPKTNKQNLISGMGKVIKGR